MSWMTELGNATELLSQMSAYFMKYPFDAQRSDSKSDF